MKIDTQNIKWRIIDGEAVILHLDTGSYYSFNKTGTEIWKSLSNRQDREEIILQISKKYSISQKRAEKDVDEFLEYLKKDGLVK